MREKISDAKEINLRYNKSAFYKISGGNLDKTGILSSEEGLFMKHKVIKKQENARQCFACGVDNPMGLKAFFYEMDNDELVAIFQPLQEHQSYPGRLHGGVSAAILDETIGRAVMIKEPEMWGVTVELSLKYRKPVPLDIPLKVVGRITRSTHRIFEGSGEILLEDGTVAVEAQGRYLKMPIEKITTKEFIESEEMHLEVSPQDPEYIDF